MLQVKKEYEMARFTETGDGAFVDALTGLYWEMKSPGNGLNGADTTFTLSTDGVSIDGSVTELLTSLNERKLAGYADWRVPTVKELQTLMDYGRCNPTAYADIPGAMSCGVHWSSTILFGTDLLVMDLRSHDGGHSWVVDTDFGNIFAIQTWREFFVRGVRADY